MVTWNGDSKKYKIDLILFSQKLKKEEQIEPMNAGKWNFKDKSKNQGSRKHKQQRKILKQDFFLKDE